MAQTSHSAFKITKRTLHVNCITKWKISHTFKKAIKHPIFLEHKQYIELVSVVFYTYDEENYRFYCFKKTIVVGCWNYTIFHKSKYLMTQNVKRHLITAIGIAKLYISGNYTMGISEIKIMTLWKARVFILCFNIWTSNIFLYFYISFRSMFWKLLQIWKSIAWTLARSFTGNIL